jgi:hypothetical protein
VISDTEEHLLNASRLARGAFTGGIGVERLGSPARVQDGPWPLAAAEWSIASPFDEIWWENRSVPRAACRHWTCNARPKSAVSDWTESPPPTNTAESAGRSRHRLVEPGFGVTVQVLVVDFLRGAVTAQSRPLLASGR